MNFQSTQGDKETVLECSTPIPVGCSRHMFRRHGQDFFREAVAVMTGHLERMNIPWRCWTKVKKKVEGDTITYTVTLRHDD